MQQELSRRERQILDIIYQLGEATASEVTELIAGDVANATVRTQLRNMEAKGVLKHRQDGKRFVYSPRTSRKSAASRAFRKVLDVFFGGSLGEALAAHLADPKSKLSKSEIARLRSLIDQQEKEASQHKR